MTGQNLWMAPPHLSRQGRQLAAVRRCLPAPRGITDLVLFGDCRPMHMVAHQMARLVGVRVHVFEEGYIRPNWLTLERDGVNGNSSLPRDPASILAAAQGAPMPPALPPIGASLGRRVRNTWDYFRHMVWGAPFYPFYQSHRPGSIIMEGFGWVFTQLIRERTAARTARALERIAPGRYFLFPLQLTSVTRSASTRPFHP
jgi:capsular polysaccharide export protein